MSRKLPERKLLNKEIPRIRSQLLKKQKNRCPICKTEIKDPCLDHDHQTGAVRDTLCRNCNGLEGRIFNLARRGKRDKTEADYLRAILRYWNKHKTNRTGLLHPSHGKKKKRGKRKQRSRTPKS